MWLWLCVLSVLMSVALVFTVCYADTRRVALPDTSNDSIFCALGAAGIPVSKSQTPLIRFVVQQAVQQVHNKSNKWSLTLRSHPVWSALMVSGQTVAVSSHGAVASPAHGTLRQPAQWQIPIHRLLPRNRCNRRAGCH